MMAEIKEWLTEIYSSSVGLGDQVPSNQLASVLSDLLFDLQKLILHTSQNAPEHSFSVVFFAMQAQSGQEGRLFFSVLVS